ncbi:MAG: ATP synthase subunit I, partial [Actinobacteria bacterium]|nr:ATP synthase subunit I [Actinomycetota bacterium]
MADPMNIRIEGPSPAMQVAVDLARKSVWLIPVVVIISAAFWGIDGVLSSLYAVAIVVVNFLLAAYMLAVAGRISAAVMAAAALFGFLLR